MRLLRSVPCALCLLAGCQTLDASVPTSRANGSPDADGVGGDGERGRNEMPDARELEASADAARDARPVLCPETTPVPPSSTARLELTIEPVLGGKPFIFGQSNDVPGGATVTPLNFRFYVTHLKLQNAQGSPVGAALVTETNAPAPYDVQLFNAEDASTAILRLAVPPGDYAGLELVFGIDDDCNAATMNDLKPPLSAASQMSWPHLAGYLFFRFEGRIEQPDAGGGDAGGTDGGIGWIAPAIHMGGSLGLDGKGVVSAPVVKVQGALHVDANAPGRRTLRVVMDEIFRGANADVDTSQFVGFPSPETNAGERLRQSLPNLTVFELVP